MLARRGLIIAAAASLAACATGERYATVSQRLPPLSPRSGRIWVYRAPQPIALAVQPDVLIDGQVAGRSVPGGFFYRDVATGTHVVTTSTDPDRPLSVTIGPGEEKFVRTTARLAEPFGGFRGHVYPELADPNIARAEVRSMSYAGPM